MDSVWSAIEAVSTACAALIVLAGLLYAKSQVGEARRSRNAELLLEIHNWWHASDMRVIRDRLLAGEFGPPSKFDSNQLSEADSYAVWTLLDRLEMLGVLVEKRLVDVDLVVAAFRNSPPQVWYYVRPHLLGLRKLRPPGNGLYLEKLAERYEEYYMANFGIPHPAYERIMALEAPPGESARAEGSST